MSAPATSNGSTPAPVLERTGKYLGIATVWRGARVGWREVWLRDDPPAAAKVTVRRLIDGEVFESSAVAHLSEHVDDSPAWEKMPATTLAEIAAAKALRQTFPMHWRDYTAGEESGALDTTVGTTVGTPIGGRGGLGLTAEQRTEVDDAIRGLDQTTGSMLCIAAGVDSTDKLTQASLPAFREALAAHKAGVAG